MSGPTVYDVLTFSPTGKDSAGNIVADVSSSEKYSLPVPHGCMKITHELMIREDTVKGASKAKKQIQGYADALIHVTFEVWTDKGRNGGSYYGTLIAGQQVQYEMTALEKTALVVNLFKLKQAATKGKNNRTTRGRQSAAMTTMVWTVEHPLTDAAQISTVVINKVEIEDKPGSENIKIELMMSEFVSPEKQKSIGSRGLSSGSGQYLVQDYLPSGPQWDGYVAAGAPLIQPNQYGPECFIGGGYEHAQLYNQFVGGTHLNLPEYGEPVDIATQAAVALSGAIGDVGKINTPPLPDASQ